jgi:hypothetical protein
VIGPPCKIGLLLLFLGIVMPSSSSSSSADADATRRMIGVIISVWLLLLLRVVGRTTIHEVRLRRPADAYTDVTRVSSVLLGRRSVMPRLRRD